MLMVIPCFLMLVCHGDSMLLDVGLPGAISQICFHLFVCSPLIASGQAPRGWTAEHLATGGVETKRAERERIGSISPILVPGFVKMEDLANNNRLVGGWNMNFMFSIQLGMSSSQLKPPINRDLLGLTGIYRLECDLTRR